jgi:hypothetical protein
MAVQGIRVPFTAETVPSYAALYAKGTRTRR